MPTVAVIKKCYVFQLDVNSAFLHGELSEDVYVNEPVGYHKGNSGMLYKLIKALYGLRKALRAWYSKIDSYFCIDKFVKYPYEHTLFVKDGLEGKMIIVRLYVDDLIYIRNDLQTMDE